MKKFLKINLIAILILSVFLLSGCSKKIYTFKNENIMFQYDGEYLKTTKIENIKDIIIRPISGDYSSFVDATIIDTEDKDYDKMLRYMQAVYTYNLESTVEITKEEKDTIKTEFGENEISILNYSYTQDGMLINIESKAIKIEETKVFIVIKKITENTLDQKTLNSLNVTFESAFPYK